MCVCVCRGGGVSESGRTGSVRRNHCGVGGGGAVVRYQHRGHAVAVGARVAIMIAGRFGVSVRVAVRLSLGQRAGHC